MDYSSVVDSKSVSVQVFSVSLQGCIFLPGKELYKYRLFHKAWFIFKLLSFLHWLVRLRTLMLPWTVLQGTNSQV